VVYITQVRLVGGATHAHISQVFWINPVDNKTGVSTRDEMVTFLRGGGQAFVSDGVRSVAVGVVEAQPPYIRTHADGVWADNLLALPTF
jgi:hypothetical protein